jgi:type I restriction enzyme S subunit
MQGWRKCTLGDLLEIKHGFAFKGEFFSDEGPYVLLTPGNFLEEGGLKLKGDKEKFYTGHFPSEFLLKRGDLLVAMTDLTQNAPILGSPAFIPEDGRFLHNQRLGKVVNLSQTEISPDFLFFLLNTPSVRGQIKGSATGATVRHTSPSRIYDVAVHVPPLPIQRRIAGILSAYDELIENSQRRIKILESMARALYREWFVYFRFPVHESIPRVPSPMGEIPQGWEVKSVADAFEILGGGTPSRKEDKYWQGGHIQWFSPSDLTGAGTMFMDDSSDHITRLGLAESSARLFPAMSVMLTSRATIGAIAINTREACTNQGFITCLPNDRVPLYFLFHWVAENVPTFQRMASGATFKEISRGVFKTIEFLQPPKQLTERFEAVVAPMAEQVLALQRQVQNLRRTRDLLLPCLLSGQIELEAALEAKP